MLQVSSDLSIPIQHSRLWEVLELKLHVLTITFTVSQQQKHRKPWKLEHKCVTLSTSLLYILKYSEKYFNLWLYKMLSATCCKTIPFIFPLIIVKHCFKNKKKGRQIPYAVLLHLSLLVPYYFGTGIHRKGKKKILLSRHQGSFAKRSFTSTGIQHSSQEKKNEKIKRMHYFSTNSTCSLSHLFPQGHSFSSQKVKEVCLRADSCQRNLSSIKTDISLARQISLLSEKRKKKKRERK